MAGCPCAAVGAAISLALGIANMWVVGMAVRSEPQFIKLLVPMIGLSFCTVIHAMCVQSCRSTSSTVTAA